MTGPPVAPPVVAATGKGEKEKQRVGWQGFYPTCGAPSRAERGRRRRRQRRPGVSGAVAGGSNSAYANSIRAALAEDLRRAGLSDGALIRATDSAFREGIGAVDPPANARAINLSGATLTPAQWASANIPAPRLCSVSCSASIPG